MVILADVIYVPGLEYNLFSLEAFHLAGIWTIGSEYGYYTHRMALPDVGYGRVPRTKYLFSS